MFCYKSNQKGFVTLQVVVILGVALFIMVILLEEAFRNIENEISVEKEVYTNIKGW